MQTNLQTYHNVEIDEVRKYYNPSHNNPIVIFYKIQHCKLPKIKSEIRSGSNNEESDFKE
jgi:hypothetical protein